jgi:thiamine biosynthesis lipoprotein
MRTSRHVDSAGLPLASAAMLSPQASTPANVRANVRASAHANAPASKNWQAQLPRPGGAWVQREEPIMGTAIRVELWCEQRSRGVAAAAAVLEEMHRIDRAMSPHHANSELCRINREAAQRAVPLSAEMCMLIERALHWSRISNGAFDISYAAVGQHYDYRRHQRPDAQLLARSRELVGWQQLQLDPAARTLRFGRQGMRIDLGGFAKGHAVDCCAQLLRERGIAHAMVSAGGDSRVIGARKDSQSAHGTRPWAVAIRHPRKPGEVVAVLPLEDTSISTSGDYERYFDDGGERVHHLIDPATGCSPQGIHSVTVLAADGLTSEALSKAVFVMGVQRGLALINSLPDVDAIVVDAAGGLHVSSGLQHAQTPPAAGQRQ